MPDDQKARIPTPLPDAKFPPDPETDDKKPGAPNPRRPGGRVRSGEGLAEAAPGPEGIDEFLALPVKEQWRRLVKSLRLNRRRLLSIPGVTAVDLGYKIEDGAFTDKLALRVHVERKLPDDPKLKVFQDRPYDFIPSSRNPPPAPEGKDYFRLAGKPVLSDVLEATYKPAQLNGLPGPSVLRQEPKKAGEVNRSRRLDPLVGGISIGSPQVPAGTLGALVWDNTDGSVCILSNWHVLSGDFRAEAGTPCFQPGLLDQGRSSDVVARLKRWRIGRQMDAAIAELTGSRKYCAGEILSLFQQITGEANPYLGMPVLKSGRSTGFTEGFIDGLYFSSAIEYGNGVVRVFEDQIHIAPIPPEDPDEPVDPISEPGDSGAVWVTKSNGEGYKAVGLHFAGDLPRAASGEYALANPMSLVTKSLDFSFRPRFLEIRDEEPAKLTRSRPHEDDDLDIQPIGRRTNRTAGSGPEPDPIDTGST